MTKEFIEIGDGKTYVEKDGAGETIIFVHADTLDSRQWDEQVKYFAPKYELVRYDIRGFGKSDLPKEKPYSFSEDLNSLMESLGIEKAHFVGLSLGAAIIIDFVLTHPDKVKSLVLADPGISGDGFDQTFINSINQIVLFSKEDKIEEAKQSWLDLDIFNYSKSHPSTWGKIQEMVTETSCYRWYGMNQPISLQPAAAERLSEIKPPTLIIVGEHDIPDFQRKAKLINAKISGSELKVISDAGHLSNLDNPKEFNEAISRFLDRIQQP